MTEPLDICLISPGMAHHGGTLAEASLGGSETAAICVTRELAKLGHHVTVFSPGHTGAIVDNVQWLPIQLAQQYLTATPHDVTVVSRAIDGCMLPFHSAVHILWCHDLTSKKHRPMLASAIWNLDALYVLSAFQKAQYAEVHPGLEQGNALFQTRNGIDLADFPAPGTVARDPWKLVYGSRPERGLENCLAIMDLCAQRNLPYRLHVSGYDNRVPHLEDFYRQLYARCEAMPNVTLDGPLPRAKWYQSLASARAVLYPGVASPFREISCLNAMEAQACGTPFVGIKKGALPETLHPDACLLVGDEDTDAHSPAHRAAIVDALVSLVQHPTADQRWQAMSDAGRAHAQTLGWDGVAQQWAADFEARRAARHDSPWRLRQHLARIGERDGLVALEDAA